MALRFPIGAPPGLHRDNESVLTASSWEPAPGPTDLGIGAPGGFGSQPEPLDLSGPIMGAGTLYDMLYYGIICYILARSSQDQPGTARSGQKQPGAARSIQEQHASESSNSHQQCFIKKHIPAFRSILLRLWGCLGPPNPSKIKKSIKNQHE